MLTDTLAFTGVVLLLALVPGPSFALVLRQTVRGGRRLAFLTTLGNATGVAFWATSAVLGLAVLVTTSTLAYDLLRGCGAAALVVSGARSLRHASRVPGSGRARPDQCVRPDPSVRPRGSGWPGRRVPAGHQAGVLAGYRTGVLVSLANPKAAVFATAVLPQFVPRAAGHLALRYLLLAAIWVLVSSAWYVVVSWLVSGARTVLGGLAVRRRVERVTGVLLIAFGIRLAAALR